MGRHKNNNKKNKNRFYFLVAGFSCDWRLCKTSIKKTKTMALLFYIITIAGLLAIKKI